MGWYRPHGSERLVWRDSAAPARDALDLVFCDGPTSQNRPPVTRTPEHADWERALASQPSTDDPTPAQHHESGAATRQSPPENVGV